MNGALRVRGAVFDLDGTLLDSMPLWMRAGEIYLASLGVKAEPGLGEKLFPMTVPESAAYLARAYPLHLSETEIADGINAAVRDFYLKTAQLKPGAADFLQGLSRRGIRLALATVTERGCAEAALERTEVLGLFAAVVTSDDVDCGKDRPDIFLRAAADLGTAPAETLVFEDALHALRTAKAAGFPTVGVYDAASETGQASLRREGRFYIRDFTDFAAFAAEAME